MTRKDGGGCGHIEIKGILAPAFEDVTQEEVKDECKKEWENMLGHQI